MHHSRTTVVRTVTGLAAAGTVLAAVALGVAGGADAAPGRTGSHEVSATTTARHDVGDDRLTRTTAPRTTAPRTTTLTTTATPAPTTAAAPTRDDDDPATHDVGDDHGGRGGSDDDAGDDGGDHGGRG